MHIEPSRTGAAATRRRSKKNPMEVLVGLVEADPTADQDRLFGQWWKKIRGDDEQIEAVARHSFTNMLTAIERGSRKPKQRTAEDMEQERRAIGALVNLVKNVVLMDIVLPNGKKLRDCTFAECSAAGGWFKLVATKGKPSELVGKVLSEEQLRLVR